MNNWRTPSRETTLRHVLAAAWIVALYFICNPYRGVRHDAVLYFGQMQNHLTPGWLGHDLFFLSNAQDKYSIFSNMLAPVLQAFGLSSAEIAILLALHALFLFATWQLTAGMPAATRWCSLGLALALPHYYAAKHRFAFAEPFLTARSLAEPFSILGLALLLRGRRMLALAAGVLAAIAHPLIALPAWLAAWRMLCAQDKRWNWAALLALLPVVALAALGVAPFDALGRTYDATWFETVRLADGFVFLKSWQITDWQERVFDAGLLWLCAREASLPLARLAKATLVAAIGCLVVSAIGTDLLHDVLITQLQLWRALWIAHLVAMLSLGPLLLGLWRQDGKGRLAVLAVLLGAITVTSAVQTGWVGAVVAFGAIALARSRVVVSVAVLRIGAVACVVAAVLISGVIAASQYDQLSLGRDSGILAGRASAIPFTMSALVLAIALLGLWPLLRPGRLATTCSAIGAALLLAIGVSQWDQRSDWSRYVEQSQGQPHPFDAVIPATSTVYWHDDLMASWALLGRSSFYNSAQMSGALFSRETSAIGMARREAVSPLVIQSRLCMSLAASGLTATTEADCRPTLVAVRDVCHLKDVHPDYIVLNSPIELPPVASWIHPTSDRSEPSGHFLYACKDIPDRP